MLAQWAATAIENCAPVRDERASPGAGRTRAPASALRPGHHRRDRRGRRARPGARADRRAWPRARRRANGADHAARGGRTGGRGQRRARRSRRGAQVARSPGSTSGLVLERGRPQRVDDVSAHPADHPGPAGRARRAHRAARADAPPRHRGGCAGGLRPGPRQAPFSPEHEELLRTFASSAANAVTIHRSVEADRLQATISAADAWNAAGGRASCTIRRCRRSEDSAFCSLRRYGAVARRSTSARYVRRSRTSSSRRTTCAR